MCYWNNKDDPTKGAHYIAIEKVGSVYRGYNVKNGYSSYIDKSVLKDFYIEVGGYTGGIMTAFLIG